MLRRGFIVYLYSCNFAIEAVFDRWKRCLLVNMPFYLAVLLKSQISKRHLSHEFGLKMFASVNKKVLLCSRKRHTALCVASTHYAVLVGVPPPPPGTWPGWALTPKSGWEGPLPRSGKGVLPCQVWMGGATHFPGLDQGYPLPRSGWRRGYSIPGLGGVPPSSPRVPLDPDLGWKYPPSWPEMGVPPIQTWEGVPPCPHLGGGYPRSGRIGLPPVCKDGAPRTRKDGGTLPFGRMGVPPVSQMGYPPASAGGKYMVLVAYYDSKL